MSAPNPEIVAKLYDLDISSFLQAGMIRRWDGTSATPEQVEALYAARVVDMEAVVEMRRLALQQSEYRVERLERISVLIDKYRLLSDTGDTKMGAIASRMSLEDRAEWDRIWDELGGGIVIRGES